MFADEARFGRINRPRPCWAPIGIRPEVASQLIREYIYLYGVVNGCQNPRKDGGAKIIGMTFAAGSAAPRRRTLGGKRRPGGKPCQRRQPPQAGAEGPG